MYWLSKMIKKTFDFVCLNIDNCMFFFKTTSSQMLIDSFIILIFSMSTFHVIVFSTCDKQMKYNICDVIHFFFFIHFDKSSKLQIYRFFFFFRHNTSIIIIINFFYSLLLIANFKFFFFLNLKYSKQITTFINVEKTITTRFVAN